MKIDHLVMNIDSKYQTDESTVTAIRNTGLSYKPKMGKGTRGFKASNIWIGREYFEMVRLLKEDGGGWVPEWTELYNKGHRGLVCLMLDVPNIEAVYQAVSSSGIKITKPEYLKFKWGFGLFTRTMPWMNSYFSFFEGVPFQIGLQQMKDQKSEDLMCQYMVPNSRDNGITGIDRIVIEGAYTENDFKMLTSIFPDAEVYPNSIKVTLKEKQQTIVFTRSEVYAVQVFAHCENEENSGNQIRIENTTILCE